MVAPIDNRGRRVGGEGGSERYWTIVDPFIEHIPSSLLAPSSQLILLLLLFLLCFFSAATFFFDFHSKLFEF